MSRKLHARLTEELRAFTSRPLFDESVILTKDPAHPRISIVTPSYNQGEFLETTILSILNQNYPNLEFIIMDGGSTDDSATIIKKYEKYVDYWTSEKDKGQSDAINRGFERSTGTILAHLNSDDVYWPGALRAAAEYFRAHPGVDVMFGDTYLIDERSEVFRVLKDAPAFRSSIKYGAAHLVQPNSFWTRDIFFRAGMYDLSFHYCMDAELWSQILKLGGRFQPLRQPLADDKDGVPAENPASVDAHVFPGHLEKGMAFEESPGHRMGPSARAPDVSDGQESADVAGHPIVGVSRLMEHVKVDPSVETPRQKKRLDLPDVGVNLDTAL